MTLIVCMGHTWNDPWVMGCVCVGGVMERSAVSLSPLDGRVESTAGWGAGLGLLQQLATAVRGAAVP